MLAFQLYIQYLNLEKVPLFEDQLFQDYLFSLMQHLEGYSRKLIQLSQDLNYKACLLLKFEDLFQLILNIKK